MTKTVHIDLAPDFEDCWVDLRDPKYMNQVQITDLHERAQVDQTVFLKEMISGWKVSDGNGGFLLDPSKDDLNLVPLGVLKVVVERLDALMNATVPKTSRTPQPLS